MPAPLGAVLLETALPVTYAVLVLVTPPPQPIDEVLAFTMLSTSDSVPSLRIPAPPSATFPLVMRKPLNFASPSLLTLTTRPVLWASSVTCPPTLWIVSSDQIVSG